MLHFTFQNMRAFFGPWPRGLGLSNINVRILKSTNNSLSDLFFTYFQCFSAGNPTSQLIRGPVTSLALPGGGGGLNLEVPMGH